MLFWRGWRQGFLAVARKNISWAGAVEATTPHPSPKIPGFVSSPRVLTSSRERERSCQEAVALPIPACLPQEQWEFNSPFPFSCLSATPWGPRAESELWGEMLKQKELKPCCAHMGKGKRERACMERACTASVCMARGCTARAHLLAKIRTLCHGRERSEGSRCAGPSPPPVRRIRMPSIRGSSAYKIPCQGHVCAHKRGGQI